MAFQIDCDYPGGNVIVERVEGDTVYLRQDWASSSEWWFHWSFRVRGAQGRALRLQFTDGDVFTARGPGLLRDGEWIWLGRDALEDNGFLFEFQDDDKDIIFAFSPPYVESDLSRFAAAHTTLETQALCESEKGRDVEHITIAAPQSEGYVFFTARTHACEAMANFVLEGIIEVWQSLPELFQRFDLHAIPFIDKDGVEEGDQGKFRKPHDHNRDFTDAPLYAVTRALMEQAPQWPGRCVFYLDMHCPWIRHGRNEELFFLGLPPESHPELQRFMAILQSTQRGQLPFDARHTIMPGQEWYQSDAPTAARWVRESLKPPIATTLEVPYALAGGQTVTPDNARAFGRDLGQALAVYLHA
jgi:hypothetical protein